MPRDFEFKRKEIRNSLNRRARLRKNYFKLSGDKKPVPNLEVNEVNLSDPDSEDEQELPGQDNQDKDKAQSKAHGKAHGKSHGKHRKQDTQSMEPQLSKKQLASKRRQEEYHKLKEEQENRAQAALKRKRQAKKVTARNQKGQPKLGSQVSLLLDKLRQDR